MLVQPHLWKVRELCCPPFYSCHNESLFIVTRCTGSVWEVVWTTLRWNGSFTSQVYTIVRGSKMSHTCVIALNGISVILQLRYYTERRSVTSHYHGSKFLDHNSRKPKQQWRWCFWERLKSNRFILEQICTCITLFVLLLAIVAWQWNENS